MPLSALWDKTNTDLETIIGFVTRHLTPGSHWLRNGCGPVLVRRHHMLWLTLISPRGSSCKDHARENKSTPDFKEKFLHVHVYSTNYGFKVMLSGWGQKLPPCHSNDKAKAQTYIFYFIKLSYFVRTSAQTSCVARHFAVSFAVEPLRRSGEDRILAEKSERPECCRTRNRWGKKIQRKILFDF